MLNIRERAASIPFSKAVCEHTQTITGLPASRLANDKGAFSMSDTELRKQLVFQLTGEQAHLSFEDAVAEFPDTQINARPRNVVYTYWHLIEHLRITQRDLLDYITKADYHEGTWPDDYWPARDAQTDAAGWQASVDSFIA